MCARHHCRNFEKQINVNQNVLIDYTSAAKARALSLTYTTSTRESQKLFRTLRCIIIEMFLRASHQMLSVQAIT